MNRKEVTIAIENAVEDKPLLGYAFFGIFEDSTVVETNGFGLLTHEQIRTVIQKMRRWSSALGQQLDAATTEAMKQAKQIRSVPQAMNDPGIDPSTYCIARALQNIFDQFEKHS